MKKVLFLIGIMAAMIMTSCSGEKYSDEELHSFHSHGAVEIGTRQYGSYFWDMPIYKVVTVHHDNYSEQEKVYYEIVFSLKPFFDTYLTSLTADEKLYNLDGTRQKYYNEDGNAYYISYSEYIELDPEIQALYEKVPEPYL